MGNLFLFRLLYEPNYHIHPSIHALLRQAGSLRRWRWNLSADEATEHLCEAKSIWRGATGKVAKIREERWEEEFQYTLEFCFHDFFLLSSKVCYRIDVLKSMLKYNVSDLLKLAKSGANFQGFVESLHPSSHLLIDVKFTVKKRTTWTTRVDPLIISPVGCFFLNVSKKRHWNLSRFILVYPGLSVGDSAWWFTIFRRKFPSFHLKWAYSPFASDVFLVDCKPGFPTILHTMDEPLHGEWSSPTDIKIRGVMFYIWIVLILPPTDLQCENH